MQRTRGDGEREHAVCTALRRQSTQKSACNATALSLPLPERARVGAPQGPCGRGWALPVARGGHAGRHVAGGPWSARLLGLPPDPVKHTVATRACLRVLRGPSREEEESSGPPSGRPGSPGQEQRRVAVTQLSRLGRTLSTQFLPLTSVCSLAPVDIRKSEWHLGKGLLMSNMALGREAAWGAQALPPSLLGQRSV